MLRLHFEVIALEYYYSYLTSIKSLVFSYSFIGKCMSYKYLSRGKMS